MFVEPFKKLLKLLNRFPKQLQCLCFHRQCRRFWPSTFLECRDTLYYTLLHFTRHCVPYTLKVCGNALSSESISTFFSGNSDYR